MLTTDNSSMPSFSCNSYDDRNKYNHHYGEDDTINDKTSTEVITDTSKILTIIYHLELKFKNKIIKKLFT